MKKRRENSFFTVAERPVRCSHRRYACGSRHNLSSCFLLSKSCSAIDVDEAELWPSVLLCSLMEREMGNCSWQRLRRSGRARRRCVILDVERLANISKTQITTAVFAAAPTRIRSFLATRVSFSCICHTFFEIRNILGLLDCVQGFMILPDL